MWFKKKPLNHDDPEENGKEKAEVQRRLSNVEVRLDVLSDKVSVLTREDEARNT